MKPISKAAFLGAAIIVSLPAAATAGTGTGDINVTANVNSNCTVQTQPLAFGSYDPLVTNATKALYATSIIGVTCTAGSNPQLSIANNVGGSLIGIQPHVGIEQNMVGGPSNNASLKYVVSLDSVTGGGGITAPYSYTLTGRIDGGQDAPMGNYSSQLVATASF